ncbi:MAG: hypothetical protein A2W19_16025 [Spirochaetes bacterium RBG_16_49_21]|nr:MAG: hypothetical protein A2W19_16025 [Spirochaetes bacterium RBG_16_49_21]
MRNKQFIKDIKHELEEEFGDLIYRVTLFGSRVARSAHNDSDYDVLIVLRKIIGWRAKDKIFDAIALLNIKYDCIIDAHIVAEPELLMLKGKQPYIQAALKTGVTA